MAVYIDQVKKTPTFSNGWKYKTYCHMIADTPEELKKFAKSCGLKMSWFQPKSFPHFDLTEGMRETAHRNGAIIMTDRELIYKLKEIRKNNE